MNPPLVDVAKAMQELRGRAWVSYFPEQDPSILLANFSIDVLMTINMRNLSPGNINIINRFLFNYIPTYVSVNHKFAPPRLIVGNGNDIQIPMWYDKAWATEANRMLEFMDLHVPKHGRPLRVIDQLQWIIWRYKR